MISKKSKNKPKKNNSRFFLSKLQKTEDKVKDAISSAPRITNETVSDHREEVLGRARKYIYPLKHSRHHIVRISVGLLIAVIIGFFIYMGLELYDFQSTSGFVYTTSDVIPFPVAKAGKSWISYHSYLFELRRNIHYYETQQQADFSSQSGKAQLTSLKQQAMKQVIEDAYVKQLAAKYNITVTSNDINQEVSLLKQQNKLGNSTQVFDNVLREYWGWNEGDFKAELGQQLLQQKVVAKLDTQTNQTAQSIEEQLAKGTPFATLAATSSDDTSTKASGGQYSQVISPQSTAVAPQIVNGLFKLNVGQVSPIINTGYSLEIVKPISISGTSITAAHIQINYRPITVFTNPLRQQNPPKIYIKT
ncbi:MAG TPA: SurA N-terminal domain-containing protein [Candidatus Saccharimonadales bacterium]